MPQDNFSSASSSFSPLSLIATIVSAVMLGLTAFGALPTWGILLVPLWMVILCYLNLDRVVSFALGSSTR